MKFILVEITPGDEGEGYCATISGTMMSGSGISVEGAIHKCIMSHYSIFELTPADIETDRWNNGKRAFSLRECNESTRNLIKFLSKREIELEIKLFPCE